MCVDISLHSDVKSIIKAFPGLKDKRTSHKPADAEQLSAFVFPEFPIIYRQQDSQILTEMEWGVIPLYLHDAKERETRRRSMFNARSERILDDKKSYWHKLRNNRCLIPVSGTYEHRKIKGWSKKVPYYIWMKDRDIQYIPGLYQADPSADNGGESTKTFTMITRAGNEIMNKIHNDGENKHRMPLFLTPELEEAWLLDDLKESEIHEIFNFEMPPESMGYHPVYTLRGVDERPDHKHKYDPWNWPNLPELGNDTPPRQQTSLFDN